MARAWRIVLWIAFGMLVLGILLAGTGMLTGASIERAWETLGLQQRADSFLDAIRKLPFFSF